MIDSPVLPDELDALAALVEQAGFPAPSGLLATHGDWDHLLGRLAFPRGAALGCAETVPRRGYAPSPGAAQRELRAFDEELYIERDPSPRRSDRSRRLPSPVAAGSASSSSSCTPPTATPATGWPSGSPGRACSWPATTCQRSRYRRSAGGASMPTWPRSSACARWSRAPSTSCPATDRCSTGSGALGVLGEDLAYLRALREEREPAARGQRAPGAEPRAAHGPRIASRG